ncbi:hypothetical protein OMP43_21795 [Sphingomonas sp. CBMAI 2297]|uniref:hypothetical protein n=1 Tax=Sphingomonas sp. CBMAI 2297 TaxID=2991720 RepID=UPI0024570351|nr:hypothetical protein [Sphingomonas sp. CBMAI 2297]MDH4746664.1 hypothetical protein [Sphingomonas sp. CBMAI 2297]
MALVYHGTPLSPIPALEAVLAQRAACIPFARPDDARRVETLCDDIMYDCSAYTFWKAARKAKREWEELERDWAPYYHFLEPRLFVGRRWAVIPDRIAAPTQLNDALLVEWPFGKERGAPVWHMNEPLERLSRLIDAGYARICFGWVGQFDPAIGDVIPQERAVDCDAYHRRMEEVDRHLKGQWPCTHQFRGIAVAGRYPGKISSADAVTLALNGHRHDWLDDQHDFTSPYMPGPWVGRKLYRDRLERLAA